MPFRVTTVLQSPRPKRTFCIKSAAMATRASGLKILVSVVRFRPWALEAPEIPRNRGARTARRTSQPQKMLSDRGFKFVRATLGPCASWPARSRFG